MRAASIHSSLKALKDGKYLLANIALSVMRSSVLSIRLTRYSHVYTETDELCFRREETIQVNALSTTLLGLLLLDWMKQQRAHRTSPAHLVFVTSRDHLYPDISHWAEWSRHEGLLRHLSRKEDWPAWWATTEPNYASSKLLVMYAIDRISEMAKGPEGE